MSNSWKMRCVALNGSRDYTVGKVYTVENGTFTSDSGWQLRSINGGQLQDFESWCKQSISWWELVEDEMTTQEKIKKAEAKIAKWQEKLDALKQEKPLTGWEVPKNGDKCYNIQGNGEIERITHVDSSGYYAKSVKYLNAFSTEEKAKEIAKEQLAYRIARKFADEWEGKRDENCRWQVFCYKSSKTLGFWGYDKVHGMADLFPSEDCAKAFIDRHGKEYAQLLGWELEG